MERFVRESFDTEDSTTGTGARQQSELKPAVDLWPRAKETVAYFAPGIYFDCGTPSKKKEE